jgi:hypothetical protein
MTISRNCANASRKPCPEGQGRKKYDELLALDLEFHAILGRAGKNKPLETIYRFVMQYFLALHRAEPDKTEQFQP